MAVYKLEWLGNLWGSPQRIIEYGEASTQSFKAGDPVKLVNGLVTLGVDTEFVGGIALKDATTATTGVIPVQLFWPGDIYVATLSAAGANSATVHAITHLGKRVSFIKSTETGETAKTVFDDSDTTTPHFEIINLDPRDAVGTAGGRVWARVLEDQARLLAS